MTIRAIAMSSRWTGVRNSASDYTRIGRWERVEPDDIRAVLQDALESAEDGKNAAALTRILEHLASEPLDLLGRS